MAEYETVKSEEYKYGENDKNFIEVALKRVDDAQFVSVSKGFYTKAGNKRYKNGIGFPAEDTELRDFLVKTIKEI